MTKNQPTHTKREIAAEFINLKQKLWNYELSAGKLPVPAGGVDPEPPLGMEEDPANENPNAAARYLDNIIEDIEQGTKRSLSKKTFLRRIFWILALTILGLVALHFEGQSQIYRFIQDFTQ